MKIHSINGPVVKVKDAPELVMMEMVYVGERRLIGEVISINRSDATIQVYEGTTGLKPGEPVEGTGAPMEALLGPGILRNIFDGIERPLKDIEKASGSFISDGLAVSPLDMEKEWDVTVTVNPGDMLYPGTIFATCPETALITHRSMVPPNLSGVVTWCGENGKYNLTDPLVKIQDQKGKEHILTLCQRWPIRQPRSG